VAKAGEQVEIIIKLLTPISGIGLLRELIQGSFEIQISFSNKVIKYSGEEYVELSDLQVV